MVGNHKSDSQEQHLNPGFAGDVSLRKLGSVNQPSRIRFTGLRLLLPGFRFGEGYLRASFLFVCLIIIIIPLEGPLHQ